MAVSFPALRRSTHWARSAVPSAGVDLCNVLFLVLSGGSRKERLEVYDLVDNSAEQYRRGKDPKKAHRACLRGV